MKYPTCLVFISIHFNSHFNRNLGKLGPFPENYTEQPCFCHWCTILHIKNNDRNYLFRWKKNSQKTTVDKLPDSSESVTLKTMIHLILLELFLLHFFVKSISRVR